MVPLSTVCESSKLKESKSYGIFGWKAVGKAVSQVSSPMKAMYYRVRACEEVAQGDALFFASLPQPVCYCHCREQSLSPACSQRESRRLPFFRMQH